MCAVLELLNLNEPVFFSTVVPGKFETLWFKPVNALNKLVLPQFGLPTSATVISFCSN
jgi:hypothetical protein